MRHLLAAFLLTAAATELTAQSSRPTQETREILALDSAWARTYARHDTTLAKQLMADDFFMTSTAGTTKDKNGEMGDIRAQPGLQMHFFRTEDVRAQVYAGAAVVTGLAAWEFEMNGRTSSVKRRYTAVYARGGPLGWRLVTLHMGRAPE